ncbi:hypothetical protein Ancab_010817 [Ancistrocladus abbreviatus]
MEAFGPKDSSPSLISSPYSSPNLSSLLKIKVISWSQETGLPVTVHVRVADRTFNLHKFPLCSRSGYFKNQLNDSTEIELPPNFPGGPETFEMIALFIYGSSTFIDPFNVAALRCAAEFLEMTEDHAPGNLCERTDLYLNQVVLQSWDDTLIVLQKSQNLLPLAEELLIVSRCVESLAFMACMEILDPERKRDRPVMTLETLAAKPWCCEMAKEIVCQDLWIKDLIALPFSFFKRIIGSLRRQGMKEKYVSPIVVFYTNKWVISKKTRQFWECLCDKNGSLNMDKNKVLEVLEGVLDLMPTAEKASRLIPVGFYFAVLARGLELELKTENRKWLQEQIVSLLPLANVEDFLLPKDRRKPISSSVELAIMESIFSIYVSSNMDTEHTPPTSSITVAELWDSYLAQVAADVSLAPPRFTSLIDVVPISHRQSHDHLYKAVTIFLHDSGGIQAIRHFSGFRVPRFYWLSSAVHLSSVNLGEGVGLAGAVSRNYQPMNQARPDISQEEKGLVCKYLNCQKLSQEMCIEAVQNELMPLRLIVQALFVQQLNTQQTFKECSESFRYIHDAEFSGSICSSRYPNFKSQSLGESPYMDGGETDSRHLNCLLVQKDLGIQGTDISKTEYESTSFRILNLEHELMSLKKSLQLQKSSKNTEQIAAAPKTAKPFGLEGKSLSRKRNPLGQVAGCIGSVNLASQRRYASRILKIFQRIVWFGRGKQKRRSSPPGLWPNPT